MPRSKDNNEQQPLPDLYERLARANVFDCDLIAFDFFRQPESMDEKLKASDHYNVKVTDTEIHAEGDVTAFCAFSVWRRFKKKKVVEVSATYFLRISDFERGARPGKDDAQKLAEFAARTVIWSQFTKLFDAANIQCGERMPPLPLVG